MITATYLLLGAVCSALVLAAAPAQAGGALRIGSQYFYDRFHGHPAYYGFYRHREHRIHSRYRGCLRGGCLGYRPHGSYGHPTPPYSASIEGELARLYRSGPKVYAHYGADAPMWSEEHVARHLDAPQTMLHIVMASLSGEVSVDRRDLGHAGQWPHGRVQLAVSPGLYTVHLRRNGSVYSRQVQVYEGMATIVKAGPR